MNFAQSFQKLVPHLRLGGRYQVVRPLGSGGFSETFLAQDTQLPGQPYCVIKQLKPHSRNLDRWQVAKRLFDTEAAVLYRLGNHDRIPRLLAHFEDNQNFYLVQEFIEGESLRQKLAAEHPWSEARVLALLRDILQILVYVHDQQVIHRDIKPSNLICRQIDGRMVLIDFGAVKQVSTPMPGLPGSEEHSLTISIGTNGYMPIEQFSGTPRFNSDIYAVGMIGIEALTGTRPNLLKQDTHSGEVIWRENWDAGSGLSVPVSAELAEILDTMVRYHFKERYQTAEEPLQAIEALLKQRSDIDPDKELAALVALSPTTMPAFSPPAASVPAAPSAATPAVGLSLVFETALASAATSVSAQLASLSTFVSRTMRHLPGPKPVVQPEPSPTPVTQLLPTEAAHPASPTSRTVPRRWLAALGGVSVVAAAVFTVVQSRVPPNVSKSLLTELPCQEPSPAALPSREPDLIYSDGTRYYGAVANGVPATGRGTMVFPTGNRYDGEFQNGKRSGCGTYSFVTGRRYVGQFQNDQFQGQGLWLLDNGDRYVGGFQENRCHGEGTYLFADGRIQRGRWRNGNLEGGNLSCNP